MSTENSSFKWERKYSEESLPFADKIPLIRSLILNVVDNKILEKIYIFGSYAYGQPDEKSDIDICVVINNDQDWIKVGTDINCIFCDHKIIPSDVLVLKHDEFYDIRNPQGIQCTIMEEGKLLYG
jgi:hypothetical protein